MSEIIKPLILDETGKAIVEALTQREMTKTRIAEINAAADAAKSGIETKTDEQVERITEVTALAEDVNQLKADIESLIDKSLNLITELNYGYTYGSDSESIAESASNIITNLIEVETNTDYIIYSVKSDGTIPYTRIITYKSDGSFGNTSSPTTIGVDNGDGTYTVSFTTSNLKFDKIRILTMNIVDTSTFTFCKADDWNGTGLPITGDKIKEDKLPESYHNLFINAVQSTGITVTDSTSAYYDANNIKENVIVRYGGAGNNVPSTYGTLLSFTGSTIGGMTHLFIVRTGKMYYRIYWSGTWTDWLLVNTSNIEPYCSFALFETIGVVGDSYASGASGESSSATTAVDHNHISWCQMLARRNGVDVTNYTKGGLSTRTWLTNSTVGLTKLLSDNPKGLYILALIRNDYNIENNGETGYIGSIADITENNLGSYPDSFYGNYATIIERIQNHAPNAKIVLMTGDYVSSNELGTSYNNAVEEIAGHYNLPCMVQLEDEFFSSDYYRKNWASGGHPSAIIYSGMEMAIERMFNKCVNEYKDYFTYYIPPTTD